MSKKDLVQISGQVEKILGGGRYRVKLENGYTITAQLSGRMRRFHIRVILGDRVQCGVSPYDPSHGFITYREPAGGRSSSAGQS
ncbi:MAG: translation initiation factor IF-1 [Myxococcota bacterium]